MRNKFEMNFSGRRWRLVVGVCGLLIISASATAQSQLEDDEIDSVAASEAQQETQISAAERAREAELLRELQLRRQAIDELQGSQGIYAPELQEAYGELAQLYEDMEDFDSAISIRTDALQINRINTGLYSEQQLPIIQSLIENNGHERNWEEADDLETLLYHISSRLFELNDAAYLGAAERYGTWKLRLLRENLLDLGYSSYSRAAEDLSEFYQRLIANLEVQADYKPENMMGVFNGKSQADLVMARAIASTPYTAFAGSASRYTNQQRCRNVRNSLGNVVTECVSVKLDNPRYRQSQLDEKQFILSRRVRDVEDSIARLRQIQEQSNELSRAQLDQLESQIAALETEVYQLRRQSRSGYRF